MEDQHFFVKIVKNRMHFILVLKFFFLLPFLVFAEDFIYGLDDIPVFERDTEFLEIKLESTGSFSTAQFSIYPK